MKRYKIIWFSCLAFAVLLLAVFLSSGRGKDNNKTYDLEGIVPDVLYAQAADNIHSSDNLSYYVANTQTIHLENQEFTRYSQQRLNIQDPGKESMRCSMVELVDFGSFSVDLAEYYMDGNGYVTVGGSTFTSPLSASHFMERYAPAVCFDPALYADIRAVSISNQICIFFNNPNAAEPWALPVDAVFSDASGYAVLDKTGALQESVYTVTYRVGSTPVTQSTKIIMAGQCQVLSPEKSDTYMTIDCFDAPRMLEQACGFLLQAENVHSSAQTIIDCQTFSIHRTQHSDLTLNGSDEDFYAKLDVRIDQTNQSRGGEISQIHQTEIFQNGIYSISVNGATATENKAIDAAAMKDYCQDMLIGDILMPKHIAGATLEETDSEVILTFLASDALAEAICSNICKTLYSDGELLHALSSDYNTQSMRCTLHLEKHTGLPLSFSCQYSASHTIEEISYQLESKTEQIYQYTKTSGQ